MKREILEQISTILILDILTLTNTTINKEEGGIEEDFEEVIEATIIEEVEVERRIADVKTVSLGAPSYYKPGAGGRRAVEFRESEVPGDYRRTAAKMDISLGHADGRGPVTRRLLEYGQVLPRCLGG